MSKEKKPKYNPNLKYVNEIQDAAINTNFPNCISRKLEYQQALSVLLRSKQLKHEGKLHPSTIHPEAKEKQISKCYEQRERYRK